MFTPKIPRRAGAHAVMAAVTCTLVACGGGGADETAAPAAPAAPAATTTTTTTTPAPLPPTAGTRATCNLPDFQAEALRLVNAARAGGASCGSRGPFAAATPLVWNAALTQAALVHSDDMVASNFFDHTGSDGSVAGLRVTAAGYDWRTWGENIAAGQPTVPGVMAGWMSSSGHCANIMAPAFREIGMACVSGGASNAYRNYWTMVLGAQR